MNCMNFINLIPYYLDNDVTVEIKLEMEDHIKYCEDCKEILNKRKLLMVSFKNVLINEDIKFKSRKTEILKNINKSRYSNNIRDKIFYHVNSHKTFYGTAIAAIFLMIIVFNFGGNLYKPTLKYSSNMKANTKAMDKQSSSDIATKQDETNNTKTVIESQPTSTVTIKYDILPKGELNPTGDGVSSTINSEYGKVLTSSLEKMKTLSPGVGPWRTIYCNNGKLIFYNYNHLVAYNYNEKEKGIYSILDFSKLKVGSYQGSQIVEFSFSPNGNYCLIGTLTAELDIKYNSSLYMYKVNDGTIKEIATNFSMIKDNVKWYSNTDSSSKWIVSAKDDRETILWDVNNSKALEQLQSNVKEVKDNAGRFLSSDNLIFKDNVGNITKLDPELYLDSWWFKDDNTLIGAPYISGIQDMKLTDFQVVEINIKDKTGKIVFRP